MSSALTDARANAEAPDVSTNAANESRIGGLLAGSLLGPLGTLIGGVIGGSLGRERDEAEQENARQRMVRLVMRARHRLPGDRLRNVAAAGPRADRRTCPGTSPAGRSARLPPPSSRSARRRWRLAADRLGPVTVPPTSSRPHGHPARPAFLEGNDVHTVPGVVTAAGPDPTATEDEQQWWGTAPAVAGVVGAAVAGTIAAAGAAANRDGRGEDKRRPDAWATGRGWTPTE